MTIDETLSCFVVSPFGEPYDSYFVRIIKPALDQSGFYAVRGDSLFRPASIMDDIWLGIREAKILIAELTGRNPNVFYELGLAHALSKPVILISSNIDDVPFDLRSIRVLLYNKDDPEWGAKLRGDIIQAIKEVVASPQLAIPATFKTAVHTRPPPESEVLLRLSRLESAVERLTAIEAEALIEDTPAMPSIEPKIGDTVFHSKFGRGLVMEADGRGDQYRVKVNFDTHGVKWLMSKYANMQLLK
jgi:hypothetical protein